MIPGFVIYLFIIYQQKCCSFLYGSRPRRARAWEDLISHMHTRYSHVLLHSCVWTPGKFISKCTFLQLFIMAFAWEFAFASGNNAAEKSCEHLLFTNWLCNLPLQFKWHGPMQHESRVTEALFHFFKNIQQITANFCLCERCVPPPHLIDSSWFIQDSFQAHIQTHCWYYRGWMWALYFDHLD